MLHQPSHPARWTHFFIYGLLLLLTVAGLRMGGATIPTVQAETQIRTSTVPSAFGPILFIVSAGPEREAELFGLVPIHARLGGEQPRFVASASQDEMDRLAGMGYAVQLLEESTAGQVYYFIEQHGSAGAGDLGAKDAGLIPLGRVLWIHENEALIAVERGQERSFVDAAPAQDLHLSLLSPDRLVWTPPYDPARSPAQPQEIQANPFVIGLLDQVSEAQISTLIGQLSGAQPAPINGTAITLNSRYTFATRIRDAERYLYQFYEERGIPVQYWDWTYGSYAGRNVIAQLTGTQHPERIWIVGGHFDSISQDAYNSAPGADDNGSGSAATLVIADILRNVQLADTVRFVHFSGEEQGQWGSKPYARSLALAGEQVMGYIDLDMIGWDGNGDRVMEIHTGTGQASNDLGTMWMAANAAYGQALVVERKVNSASRFSDHSPFWDNGFPAFLAIENFFADAIPNDRNPWYHNTGDLLSRVDLGYVVRHAKVALAVLAEQAGAFTGPTPTPTNSPTATPTLTPTATPQPGCAELVVNGGFESMGGWSFGPTPLQAGTVTVPILAGSRALRMGAVDPSSTAYSHSSAYQSVSIPAGATSVTLSVAQRPGSSGDSGDYREILLLNDNLSFRRTLERVSPPGSDQWQSRQFDLMAERGAAVVLYFNVFNNGSAPATVNYVDEVSLIACVGATPTPSATPSSTPTSVPTSTSTSTPTNTPSSTPSSTPTSEPTSTPTSEPSTTPTATSTPNAYPGPTQTPLPTVTPTETPGPYPAPSQRVFVPILLRLFGVGPSDPPTPTPTQTPTSTPTSTPTVGSTCQELVVNGGFESNEGWRFGSTPAQAFYVTDASSVFAGQRALGLGIPPGDPNRAAYSTAYQTIALPTGMAQIRLVLQERPVAGDSGDFREILLLRPDYSYLARLDRSTAAGDGQWRARSFDLTARQGESVVLYFNTYNNGSNSVAATYLDQVSVLACP